MKIIKSFLLVTFGLCATSLLHAQEVKTEILKETEIKAPPDNIAPIKPSPALVFKPMNGVAPNEAPAAALQTPSPLKKDEHESQVGPINNLTAEQLKTLNGIADKPKQIAPAATMDAQQNIKPGILLAPAPGVIKN